MGALDLMFQNGMKNQGALAAGQQVGLDQQAQQGQIDAQNLANQSNAQLNPLRAQMMQGQIDQQQAQLPGIVGQSQSQAAQGQYDTDTNATRIASRLSDLTNQMGVNGVQKMGQEGAIASQAAAALSQYPPALHKQVFSQIVQQYGGDPNSPTFQGLNNLPDAQFQQGAAALGKGMVMASGDYMQKQALQTQELQNRASIAAGNNAATLGAAKISADSRVQAASVRNNLMMNHMSIDQKISYLSDLKAQGQSSPQEDMELNDLKSHQMQVKASSVNPVGAQVMGLPTAAQVAGGQQGPSNFTNNQQGQGQVTIPQGAVDMLKSNPSLRTSFDQKYGAGASKSVLGN